MARIKQKGKAGAAKAYTTRSSAVKKLQCSLADFRRLCILKGIFPREPRHKKRANKGSSAPTSFYYTKDIAFLAHEPVLKKLREHKAFAKKLARALGRGEWSSAKSLEEGKPVYRLDHIIKERYPTFIDALRDIDDALCLVSLFASLPSNPRIPPSLIANCSRLSHEWQLYVMHSKSLRKVFLSIKGIYYQAEVMGQTITWLVPYMFPQAIPSDVDVRVMLTFLELYQTLLGFVFFKLFTDLGLVYPPPMDVSKDESAAGVGAFSLQEVGRKEAPVVPKGAPATVEVDGKKVSGKDVRQTIKTISAPDQAVTEVAQAPVAIETEEEEFIPQPSTSSQPATLATLQSISTFGSSAPTNLFSSLSFYLSRETPRPLMEFIIRSFGGRLGWPESSGSGSPYDELDETITHVVIDRPVIPGQPIIPPAAGVSVEEEPEEIRERKRRRKYIQPQWVVDCVNAGKLLGEEKYERGKILPPHLSPFGADKDGYIPESEDVGPDAAMEVEEEENSESEENDEVEVSDHEMEDLPAAPTKSLKVTSAAATTDDPAVRRAAELEAEAAGIDFGTFEKAVKKEKKKAEKAKKDQQPSTAITTQEMEGDMNKMMMSNKQRKLYEKMKFGEKKRESQRTLLEKKKEAIKTEKTKEAKRQKLAKV